MQTANAESPAHREVVGFIAGRCWCGSDNEKPAQRMPAGWVGAVALAFTV